MAILGKWSGGVIGSMYLTDAWVAPAGLFPTEDRNDSSIYTFTPATSLLTLPASGLADGYLLVAAFEHESSQNDRHTPQGKIIQASGTGTFVGGPTGGFLRDNSENRAYVRCWAFVDNPSASATFQFQWKRDAEDANATDGTNRSEFQVIPLYYSDFGAYSSTSAALYGGTTPTVVTGFTGTDGTNITISSNVVSVTGDNKRYLVLGSQFYEGRAGRTQRWHGLDIDGTQEDAAKAYSYYREANNDENGDLFTWILETVTATVTIEQTCYRGDGITALLGGADGDGSTPSVGDHTLVVLELNDDAEVFRSRDTNQSALLATTGPVDLDANETTDFNDTASFTDLVVASINCVQTADYLFGANVSAASNSVADSSRWTAFAEFIINGVEDPDSVAGDYMRNNQSSIDCFGWSANLLGFQGLTAGDDVGVSVTELVGSEGGGAGVSPAGWTGFWGLNLDTLEAAAGGETLNFYSKSDVVTNTPASELNLERTLKGEADTSFQTFDIEVKQTLQFSSKIVIDFNMANIEVLVVGQLTFYSKSDIQFVSSDIEVKQTLQFSSRVNTVFSTNDLSFIVYTGISDDIVLVTDTPMEDVLFYAKPQPSFAISDINLKKEISVYSKLDVVFNVPTIALLVVGQLNFISKVTVNFNTTDIDLQRTFVFYSKAQTAFVLSDIDLVVVGADITFYLKATSAFNTSNIVLQKELLLYSKLDILFNTSDIEVQKAVAFYSNGRVVFVTSDIPITASFALYARPPPVFSTSALSLTVYTGISDDIVLETGNPVGGVLFYANARVSFVSNDIFITAEQLFKSIPAVEFVLPDIALQKETTAYFKTNVVFDISLSKLLKESSITSSPDVVFNTSDISITAEMKLKALAAIVFNTTDINVLITGKIGFNAGVNVSFVTSDLILTNEKTFQSFVDIVFSAVNIAILIPGTFALYAKAQNQFATSDILVTRIQRLLSQAPVSFSTNDIALQILYTFSNKCDIVFNTRSIDLSVIGLSLDFYSKAGVSFVISDIQIACIRLLEAYIDSEFITSDILTNVLRALYARPPPVFDTSVALVNLLRRFYTDSDVVFSLSGINLATGALPEILDPFTESITTERSFSTITADRTIKSITGYSFMSITEVRIYSVIKQEQILKLAA